ncbi:MAG: zinc-binding alcohol dehydrogenase [Phycisphaeraceae bacterium]
MTLTVVMKGMIAVTARVIHFPRRGHAELITDPMPTCGAGQILVKTEYSGVSNGTERSFLMGGPYGGSRWPCRCGYQTVGRVVELGDGVTGYAVGDRVFGGNFRHHGQFMVFDVADLDSPTNLTVVLPDGIDPTHAALFGVAAVSLHDIRRCDVRLGDRVLVVGAGLIGQFAAQAARAAGAEVTLCNRGAGRLALARQCGVRHLVEVPDEPAWKQLRGQRFDVCLEDSGADILDQIIGRSPGDPGVLRYGGKLFLCAGRFDVTYPCLAAQTQGLEFLHATHFKRRDLLELVRLTAHGLIRIEPLVQDVVLVDRAPQTYARLRDEPQSLMGTVFQWP